ncbi:MAG: glycoside hydrolase family 57 protein [Campylobacterales bacterium]|nr:glycoside hydrolase family 57 protein [Campylobacterales bacterium]
MKLSFLWHMHQPDYRDADGVMKMPWVFLHAIKDYYDMPWTLSLFPTLRATFNLTPSLIEQLRLYSEPLKYDYFLQLWSKHPSELSFAEREWVIKICKSPNYETMIHPMPRFAELYALESLDDEQFLDLQMQFMLSWCGNYLRQNSEVIKSMFIQERDYAFADKARLLNTLTTFVGEILPYYKTLLQSGVISVSTTPYFHPILPLLIDMDNVQKANIHTKPPQNALSFKADAIEHVRRAIALYKETFDTDPIGFWPAEGAVDEESVKIYKNEGIKWIATDEAILFKSLHNTSRDNLYKLYNYDGLCVAFRDHGISDLLGFDYRFKPSDEATEHFVHTIKSIAFDDEDTTLFIILDGENAWEYYPQNAYPFFTQLYEKLSNLSWCESVRMDDLLHDEVAPLHTLSPGSWIGGDFSTWSGHVEKNRAWEFLFQTRRDVDNYTHEINEQNAKLIENHFLAAECSDWFWWYGDDHFTDFAMEFDALFRKHLISIYHLLNMQPPADLFEPIIKHKSTASFMVQPQAPIYPKIDGKFSSFFEWIGCGVIDESRLFSTMDRARGPIQTIRYGHNETMVFVAFYGDIIHLEKEKITVNIIIEELSEVVSLKLNQEKYPHAIIMQVESSFEIALPKTMFAKLQKVHLRFEIEEDKKIIQTLPGFGALEVQLNEDYSSVWFI